MADKKPEQTLVSPSLGQTTSDLSKDYRNLSELRVQLAIVELYQRDTAAWEELLQTILEAEKKYKAIHQSIVEEVHSLHQQTSFPKYNIKKMVRTRQRSFLH